jgi:hypothetical protein
VSGILHRRARETACGATAARRVVLLGASNLTKSIGRVIASAQSAWEGPLDVLAAWGHGRSYGRTSRVLGLEMPGIEACGLWRDLAAAGELPTAALVTDIGNDLIYEEPVERIAGWVERCLDRLAAARAQSIVSLWPIENLKTLSAARFRLLRTLYFPRSRIGLAEISRRAMALDERVERLARERGMHVVRHRSDWYGFDPIHIRFGVRGGAWREILRGWQTDGPAPHAPRGTLVRSLYLRSRVPERRRLFGFEQRGRKPAARFDDGTTVSIY